MGIFPDIPHFPEHECDCCHEETPLEELTFIGYDKVCQDCLHDYCEDAEVIQNNLPGFLQEKRKEFLTFWFSGGDPNNFDFLVSNAYISEEEKIEILSVSYSLWKLWHEKDADHIEQNFRTAIPGEWEDYLKSC